MNKAEKFINEHINYRPNGYHEWVTPDDALRACKITKQETIERVCAWLKEHMWEKPELDEYGNIKNTYVCSNDCDYISQFVEQIRKALEE
jgi:hypothetical protein